MKFWKYGRVILALIVSLGMGLSFIACGTYTIGYLYASSSGIATSVPGQQLNQIAGYKIDHDFGYLTPISGSPFPSNGNNPVQEVILPGGQLMAVVNKGSSSVSMYSIGGSGVLTFQGNYFTSGSTPVSLALDASGSYLYVADQLAPDGSGRGDITAFQVNSTNGKLTLITNQNTFNTSGTQLTYFEVNYKPVQIVIASGFLFTLDQGYVAGATGTPATCTASPTLCTPDVFPYQINGQSGQLVLTQNQPLQTGALPGDLTTMYAAAGGRYLYLADKGDPLNGRVSQILPFTISANGTLQTLVGGPANNNPTAVDPDAIITNANTKFLYVANFGPTGINTPNSSLTAYTIDTNNGQLQFINGATASNNGAFPSGSGPIWMATDPSNQFLYVANFNDSTITGNIIDANTGQLSALLRGAVTNAPLQPNYIVVTSRVF